MTSSNTEIKNFDLGASTAITEDHGKQRKPWAVKTTSILMYVMACLLVAAVFAGKPAAAIFIPLIVYLAYGLSILKSSARIGTIAFSCFGLVANISAYITSDYTIDIVLIDLAFYGVILALLFSPSARNTN